MSDATGFLRLLSLLGREGETIRLARGNATQFATAPVAAEHLPAALTALEEGGWNVWYELNPSLFDRPTGRSNAGDITRITALYADIDYKEKPKGLGSLPEARDLLADLESALGVPAAAVVYSGHGIQPYWPIDDAFVTDDTRNDLAALLKRWGTLVQRLAAANGGAADNVFDLPRILRVPGPANLKQPEHPEPTKIEFAANPESIDIAWINEVLDDYEIPVVENVEVGASIVSAMDDWVWAEQDCSFVDTARREIASSVPASRHHWALKWAAILHGMIRDGCLREETFYSLWAELDDRFQYLLAHEGTARSAATGEMRAIMKAGKLKAESWSVQKLAEELRQHTHPLEQFAADFAAELPAAVATPGEELPAPRPNVSSIFTGQPLPATPAAPVAGTLALSLDAEVRSQQRLFKANFTDTGNAEKLAHHLRGQFIYVPTLGWHEWVGGQYQLDTDGHVMEAAKDMFIQMLTTAPDDDHRKWAHGSLSKGRLDAALRLCQSVPFLVVNSMNLDANAYEVNTPGGIVDLVTGELRPADPGTDFHTLSTGVTPAHVPIPKFLSFLIWAMGDLERVAYLQRLFGAALIGELRWHICPIFLGVGANGKTTLLELVGGAFGDYATVMPQKFMVDTGGTSHPTEIAQLRGVRLAIINEVPPTAKFDEDLLKALTGENYLRARFMGKDFFTFKNTCTPFIAANHLPAVKVGGPGFWRRIRKIDFDNQMPLERQNENLVREILAEESAGILQWVIDGARAVLAHGLQDPTKVLSSTRAYQLEEDTMARFLEDTLIEMPGMQTDRKQVYEIYKDWTYRQHYEPLPYIKFVREVTMIRPNTTLSTRDMFSNTALASLRVDIEDDTVLA